MQKTPLIWFNGKLIPWDDAKIHVLTHTLHYGGGAFEGIRFYKAEQGTAIFRLNEHINRLLYSTSILKMQLPYTCDEIMTAVKAVARTTQLEEGYIRPIAFYGYGKMGVSPIGNPVELAIICWPWGAYLPCERVDIKTSRYIRVHPRSTDVHAKLCGHYVNGILASLEISGTHYHEALFLDDKGFISEGVGENFFIVKDNLISTPKLDTILPGITRETIITLAKKRDFQVVEADITLEQAYNADEAFFTGTATEVNAIRSINDRVIGNDTVGPVTAMFKAAYLDLVHGRNPEFMDYLTFL